MNDTICAISTALGVGAISIIRVSGDEAIDIVNKIFDKDLTKKESHTINYGHIVYNGEIIDEVMVSIMKSPKTFTKEDIVEINSHGGNVIMRKILQICLKNGANLAEPGEFTKRAFLNGRIDLSQAESVIDIINAKSDREAKEGIKQLEGYLATSIRKIKNEILDVMTNIEVSIDYPEYDTPEVLEDDLKKKMEEVLDKLHKLEASFDNGKLIKEGIKTAIIGKPNAGKSSLLNAILKEDRAIVTEYEGTTRDTIEEFVNINGIPLKLIDTAGIRETENEVEKIGIEKSIKYAKEADLVILIIDGSKDLSKEDIEILNIVNPKKTIIILNKIDLEQKIDENTPEIVKFNNIIKISALKKEGIDKLYEKINDLFNFNQINVDNDIVITNERHKIQIQKAIQNLNKAIKSLSINMPIDIVAIGLKDVLSDLGEITGEEASEEIINEIFARFCLGK